MLQKFIKYNEPILTDHARIHFQLHSTAYHNNFFKHKSYTTLENTII